MDLGWLSLAALLVVILVSCFTSINPGVVAVALAWVLGVYVAPLLGVPLTLKDVVAGFPADLFLTMVGVTLIFTQAHVNGTLDRVAQVAVRGCRGNVGLMPIVFFLLAFVFSSVGAGNIAATAIMAPMAMIVAGRAAIPAFLMTIMVVHGALAGALSPFAPTGLIANKLLAEHGLGGHEWETYRDNLLANLFVAFAGYFLFGGLRLFRRTYHQAPMATAPLSGSAEMAEKMADDDEAAIAAAVVAKQEQLKATAPSDGPPGSPPAQGFARAHALTLVILAVMIFGVLVLKMNVGMAAFAGAALMSALRLSNEPEAIRKMPWGVIVMVCGVTVLTALLEKTGGADRFTQIIAALSTEQTAPGVVALFTGLISVYSSTSGVVLPAFLPLIPRLVTALGGNQALAMPLASSMIVGGHLVDSSPLSTLGALCIACAPASEDRQALFNKVLAWGLSMAVFGAALCLIFFGLL